MKLQIFLEMPLQVELAIILPRQVKHTKELETSLMGSKISCFSSVHIKIY